MFLKMEDDVIIFIATLIVAVLALSVAFLTLIRTISSGLVGTPGPTGTPGDIGDPGVPGTKGPIGPDNAALGSFSPDIITGQIGYANSFKEPLIANPRQAQRYIPVYNGVQVQYLYGVNTKTEIPQIIQSLAYNVGNRYDAKLANISLIYLSSSPQYFASSGGTNKWSEIVPL